MLAPDKLCVAVLGTEAGHTLEQRDAVGGKTITNVALKLTRHPQHEGFRAASEAAVERGRGRPTHHLYKPRGRVTMTCIQAFRQACLENDSYFYFFFSTASYMEKKCKV